MGTRIEDLTEFAQEPAQELVARLGFLKKVLSAGIMALYDLSPEFREYYMAKAVGLKIPVGEKIDSIITSQLNTDIYTKELWSAFKVIMDSSGKDLGQIYKILSEEERTALDRLQKTLGPPQKRKAKTKA